VGSIILLRGLPPKADAFQKFQALGIHTRSDRIIVLQVHTDRSLLTLAPVEQSIVFFLGPKKGCATVTSGDVTMLVDLLKQDEPLKVLEPRQEMLVPLETNLFEQLHTADSQSGSATLFSTLELMTLSSYPPGKVGIKFLWDVCVPMALEKRRKLLVPIHPSFLLIIVYVYYIGRFH
jgi:hypothetical protein